jgi:hypothetical protein
VVLHGSDQGPVVAVGQVGDAAVPGERDAPAAGHHGALVEHHDVVAREVPADPAHVTRRHLVVEDELGPAFPEDGGCPVGQLRVIGPRDDLHAGIIRTERCVTGSAVESP